MALLALATAGYGGGGALLGSRAVGAPRPSLQHHPHLAQWANLQSLVQDGVAFSRARLKGSRRAEGGSPLLRRGDGEHSRATAAPAAAAERGSDRRKHSSTGGGRRERSKKPKRSGSGDGVPVSSSKSSVATTQQQQPEEAAQAAGRGLIAEEREAAAGLHSSQAKVRVVALA